MVLNYCKYVQDMIMTPSKESLEQKNILLQQQIFDMRWKLLKIVDLLEKGNNDKAIKMLKKVLYE